MQTTQGKLKNQSIKFNYIIGRRNFTVRNQTIQMKDISNKNGVIFVLEDCKIVFTLNSVECCFR